MIDEDYALVIEAHRLSVTALTRLVESFENLHLIVGNTELSTVIATMQECLENGKQLSAIWEGHLIGNNPLSNNVKKFLDENRLSTMWIPKGGVNI